MKKSASTSALPPVPASGRSRSRRGLREVKAQEALFVVPTVEAMPNAALDVESEDDPVPGAPAYLRQLRLVL